MTQDKNLVWLDINASYSHSSLALPAIHACRKNDEHSWSKVSGTINSDIFLITKELYVQKPSIIAATLWLFNHDIVINICQRIKSLIPDVVIVLGGPEFNGNNKEFLQRNRFINHVFRGEGEIEFHKYLNNEPLDSISGLCYLDNDGNYTDNGTARVADFASLPAPETSSFFCFSSPFVQLEFSRGCFNSCAFCVSGGDKPIRTKSIEDIKQRIDYIKDKRIKDIRVLDRTFNYSISRAKAMLELFTHYPQMNFHLEIHPALLTDELCDILETMPTGLLHLEAGMQSLDDKVIEASQRIGSNEKAIAGLKRLSKMTNFETHADLIAGLPHYTLAQIFSDVQKLSQIGAAEIQLELLKLLPGTKMRNEADDLEIRYSKNAPYEVLQTPAISIFELDQSRLLSKLIDKFYNAKAWQAVSRKIINKNDRFLYDFLDYLTATELLEKPISLEKCGSLLYDFCKGSNYSGYLDDISLAWIANGLSLRKVEAGNIVKAVEIPENIVRKAGVHYYLWQGQSKKYIVSYDRSLDHSKPSLIPLQ